MSNKNERNKKAKFIDKINDMIDGHYKKLIIGLSILLLIIVVVYGFTMKTKSNVVNSLTTDLANVEKELSKSEKSNKDLKSNVADLDKEILKLNKTEEKEKLDKEIKSLEKEITDLNKELEDEKSKVKKEKTNLNNDIKSIEGKIEDLKKTLKKLEGDIIVAEGSPKQFPAGYLTASSGGDIKPGRYKVSNGSSNFVVRDMYGGLQVNIILGSNGVSEYIYYFSSGDEVEARSPFTLTPIE